VLAQERRTEISDINRKIFEHSQAERRLIDVEYQLDPKKNPELASLDPRLKALLELEGCFLQQRVGKITPEQRRTNISAMLDNWEQQNPELYKWLTTAEDHGSKSPVMQISDKIFPPRQSERK